MIYRDFPRSRRPPFRVALLILLLALLFATVHRALAAEVDTTWRTGDALAYTIGCADPDAALRIILDGPPVARCFVVRAPNGRPARMPAVLREWLSGPHARFDDDGTASVWRAIDAAGDTVYLPMSDEGGPHRRLPGA